jgi:hypothetical protein
VAAWVVAPLVMVALALFLRRTDVGVATRAAADRADRAALLGIPVGRIHTYVWMVATVLSFVALFRERYLVVANNGGGPPPGSRRCAACPVRAARLAVIVAVAVFLVALPYLPWVGDRQHAQGGRC